MNKKSIAMIIGIILVMILIGMVLFGTIANATNSIKHPVATIKIEGYEEPIVVELYPEYALNTVKNFIALANSGFYNGLKIHRIEKDFVIQGGDPKGNGSGGPTYSAIDSSIEKGSNEDKSYSIVGEFTKNGYDNTLKHERGVISMARSTYSADLLEEGYNSAGSQFYICLQDQPSLNGLYAAFGKVTSGMETVDKISEVELKVEVNEETKEETKTNQPAQDIIITSVQVETNGVDYGMPKVQDAFDYSAWYMKHYYGM